MKKYLVILMGVMVCLSGVAMAGPTVEQIEDAMLGATYLDFTSNNPNDNPPGPHISENGSGYQMAINDDSWGYPDTSDSSRTIRNNCLDDKSDPHNNFLATISGLTSGQTYEVHVLALGKRADAYDFEWGVGETEPSVLNLEENLAQGNGRVIVDYGGSYALPTAVEIGTYTADASGRLFFWFGANGSETPARTQLDGIAIGEGIYFCSLVNDSDLIAVGGTQSMSLDATVEDTPESVEWNPTGGPATVIPDPNGMLNYSATYTVAGTYTYDVVASWQGGAISKTMEYTIHVVDPANNTLVAHYDFESLPDPNALIDVENGLNGVFADGGDDGEPNVVAGYITGSAKACDFLGNSRWAIDAYAVDPNFMDLAYGMTIASWMKADLADLTVYGRLLAVDGLFEYGIRNTSGNAWFWMGGSNFDNSHPIADNEWHFFAVTLDPVNGLIKFFIDGQYVYERNIDTDKLFDITDTTAVMIGDRPSLNRAFEGICDDLKLYNYALTEAELLTLAAEGDLPPIVDAGEDMEIIYNGTKIGLSGELVYDDGNPSASTLVWSVISVPTGADPVNVLFDDSSVADTQVKFPNKSGDYVLRLTAFDSVDPVYDEVTINITLPTCQDVIDAGLNLMADLTGPEGVPDCHVNFDDFAAMALQWLDCVDPQDDACDWPFPDVQ